MERPELTDAILLETLEVLTRQVARRLEKHGRGAFVSIHEGFGVISEEYLELAQEVRGTDLQRISEEYFDVAVSSVIAVASMVAGATALKNETENTTKPIDTPPALHEQADGHA